MGVIRWILGRIGGMGRKLAMRSRWIAKRLWLVMLADVALTTHRHWRRLEPEDRKRLLELARKSEGRPAKNLNRRERREASELLDKLGHIEYAGNVAGIVLPFRPLSRLAAKLLEGRRRRAQEELARADAADARSQTLGAEQGPGAQPEGEELSPAARR